MYDLAGSDSAVIDTGKHTITLLIDSVVQEWNRALLADDKYWDQNAFNDLMNRGAQVSAKQRTDRLFW